VLQLILVLALVLAILAVVFALQNSGPVVVSLLVWQVEGNLALLLLVTFTLGVLTSLMVSIPAMLLRWRKRRKKAQGAEGAEMRQKPGPLPAALSDTRAEDTPGTVPD
jgi:uncharacterized integral membrane protein